MVTEKRTDILTGRQVLVAAQRSARPSQGLPQPVVSNDLYDPFLEGHEHQTPDERLALRSSASIANQPGWLLRVVPNRYPAVQETTAPSETTGATPSVVAVQPDHTDSPFVINPAGGMHEVVIECPDHRCRMVNLTVWEVARVLMAWQKRLHDLATLPQIQAVSIFRNEGVHAGASLPHCHSQIVGTHFVNDIVQRRTKILQADLQRRRSAKTCLYQWWLQSELSAATRVISANSQLVVLCPFASRAAWQVRLCPVAEACYAADPFEHLSGEFLVELASKLHSVVTALHQICGAVSFNVVLSLPPAKQPELYPWMLDVLPRTGHMAGFEILTDCEIITMAPETAAAEFRKTAVWNNLPFDSHCLTPQDYHWL